MRTEVPAGRPRERFRRPGVRRVPSSSIRWKEMFHPRRRHSERIPHSETVACAVIRIVPAAVDTGHAVVDRSESHAFGRVRQGTSRTLVAEAVGASTASLGSTREHTACDSCDCTASSHSFAIAHGSPCFCELPNLPFPRGAQRRFSPRWFPWVSDGWSSPYSRMTFVQNPAATLLHRSHDAHTNQRSDGVCS